MANTEFQILTPKSTQTLLEQLSHKPQKKWGQNFLIDGNIVRKSISLADVNPNESIVEVGPGLGTLTRALLQAGAQVYAIERDPVLAKYLREYVCPHFKDTLHLQEGDAMNAPRGLLTNPGEFKIVANLPYAISTPWLELILQGTLPERMVLMLQKEAADRYLAKPGTKSYGAITIFLEATYTHETSHKVSSHCFYPVPKVDSTLLFLKRNPHPHIFKPQTKIIIRDFFTQRRKQIGALCKRHAVNTTLWLPALETLGLSSRSRPEEIPLKGWVALDKCLEERH